ncbi:MAG: type II/IV secretion system protein [Phycisphaerales bacterium]|nr:type II/IV secretion system protein [Phycisphaerales bacterium]
MQQTLISRNEREAGADRGIVAPSRGEAPPFAASHAAGRLFDAHDFCVAEIGVPEIWDRVSGIAVREQASDIHVTAQREGAPLSLRLDGRLYGQGLLTGDVGQRLVNHVKVLARMDVSERRRPQDGSLRCEVDGRPVDLRISTLPTIHGEDLSVRILDRAAGLMRVAQLGATASQTAQINGLLTYPSGLILVSGSTGAGKTTTLYALVQQLADGSRKVVTIEDPVEYDLPGVSQSAVCPKLGLDYSTLLRSVLRQDPNVIMLGEIRDAQTAATVVRAANSGRLVLATSHATSAAAAVESLTALGAHPYYVARALRGVIAQTLVRQLCRYCAQRLDETVDEPIFADVRGLLAAGERPALSMARGCGHCRHTGYRERVGVFEVMTVSDELRRGITEGRPAARIHEMARSEGMIPIADAARLAALRGLTTIEELLTNISED